MPIDELPNEIIGEIIKSVDSLKDLATICHCSKRFSSITLPILYSSPKLTGAISMQKFLITILDKPEKACLVKSFNTRMKLLSIREETYMNDDAYCEMPAFYITTACRAKVLIIAQEVFASQSEATTWARDLFDPLCWDTVIPLLSLIMPNLEMFKTHTFVGQSLYARQSSYAANNYADEKAFLGKVFALAAMKQRRLPSSQWSENEKYTMSKLKNVSMTMHYEEEPGSQPQSILPIVQLPSLTDFTCSNLYDEFPVLRHETPSNILNLSFKDARLSSVSLVNLLPLFPHLERFEYRHKETLAPWNLCPYYIGKSIQHLKSSLKELTIGEITPEDFDELHDLIGRIDDEQQCLPLGSLVQFSKLRKLEGSMYLFMGREKGFHQGRWDPFRRFYTKKQHVEFVTSLPETLEVLVVTNCFDFIFLVIDVLFEHVRLGNGLKSLRRIDLVFFKGAYMDPKDRKGTWWEEEGQKLGIVLTRRNTD
jgi:hypothetical protein